MLNILVEYWLTDGDEPVPRATSDLRPASAAVYRLPSAGTLAALQVGCCCISKWFDSDRKALSPCQTLHLLLASMLCTWLTRQHALVSTTSQLSTCCGNTCPDSCLIFLPFSELFTPSAKWFSH